MFCSHCGHEAAGGGRFCTRCGQPLPAPAAPAAGIETAAAHQGIVAESAGASAMELTDQSAPAAVAPLGPPVAVPAGASATAQMGPGSPAPAGPLPGPVPGPLPGVGTAPVPTGGGAWTAPTPPGSAVPPAGPSPAQQRVAAARQSAGRKLSSWFEGMTGQQVLVALGAGAAAVVAVFLLAWVTVGLAASPLLDLTPNRTASSALVAGLVLAAGLGAPATLSAVGDLGSASGGVSVVVLVPIVSVTLLLVAATVGAVWFLRRYAVPRPAQAPGLALLTGVGAAAATFLIDRLTMTTVSVNLPFLGSMGRFSLAVAGMHTLRALLGALVLVGLTAAAAWSYAARGSFRPLLPAVLPGRLEAWRPHVRSGIEMLAGVLVAATLVVLGSIVYSVVTGKGGAEFGQYVVAAVMLPTAILATGAGLLGATFFGREATQASVMGIGMQVPGGSEGRYGLLAGEGFDGKVVAGIIVITGLTVLVLGLRHGLRTAPGSLEPRTAWRPVAVFVGCWILLDAFLRASCDAVASGKVSSLSAGAGFGAQAGVGLPSLILGSAVVAALVVLAGWLLTPPLVGAVPGLATRLGGRDVHPGWRGRLTDAALRRGAPAPVFAPVVAPVVAPVAPAGGTPAPGAPGYGPVDAAPTSSDAPAPAPVDASQPGQAGQPDAVPGDAPTLGALGAPEAAEQAHQPAHVTGPVPAPGTPAGSGAIDAATVLADKRFQVGAAVVGGLLLLVVGSSLARALYNSTVATPERAALAYVDALAAKDAQGALDRLPADAAGSRNRALLTNAAMSDLSGYHVDTVTANGDQATVTLRFDDTNLPRMTLNLARQDGSFGTNDWKLATKLPTLTVSGPKGTKVNQVAVDSNQSYAVFPGSYSASGTAQSALTEISSDTVRIGFDGNASDYASTSLKAEARVPDRFKDSIDQAVHAFVDGCVAAGMPASGGCYGPSSSDLTNVTWKVQSYPQVRYSSGDDGRVSVLSTVDAKLAYSGTRTSSWTGSRQENDTRNLSIDGFVSWDGSASSPVKFTAADRD